MKESVFFLMIHPLSIDWRPTQWFNFLSASPSSNSHSLYAWLRPFKALILRRKWFFDGLRARHLLLVFLQHHPSSSFHYYFVLRRISVVFHANSFNRTYDETHLSLLAHSRFPSLLLLLLFDILTYSTRFSDNALIYFIQTAWFAGFRRLWKLMVEIFLSYLETTRRLPINVEAWYRLRQTQTCYEGFYFLSFFSRTIQAVKWKTKWAALPF